MPGVTAGVYTGSLDAGTEVSSTYEGRHLTVLESELIHPYVADGFVNKGDPVCLCDAGVPTTFGWAVGVALNSATAATDYIAIDSEGIWNLTVYAENDDGNVAVEIGDALYIRAGAVPGAADADGTGDAELSKIRNLVTQRFFGYALGSIVSGGSGVIAVKVHFSPEEQQDEYAILTGATADNMKSFNLTDEQTNASGYTRALHVNVTNTGTKPTSGELNCFGIDAAVSGDMPYCYLATEYLSTSGNPTISLVSALSIYLDNMGTGISNIHMLDLQTGNPVASAAATRDAYIRCRNHGTGTPTTIFYLQANNNAKAATNFIEQAAVTIGPVAAAGTTTGDEVYTHKVRCLYGATTFYLCGVASS